MAVTRVVMGAVLAAGMAAAQVPVVDLAGGYEAPDAGWPRVCTYRLAADASMGWKWRLVPQAVDLADHQLTVDTGGGNVQRLTGAISGAGGVVWIGGGQGAWQTTSSFLGGETANSFTGGLRLTRGMLTLAKPAGTAAVCGPVTVGGGDNQAILAWAADEQVDDRSSLALDGPEPARLWLNGHRETVASVTVRTRATLDLGAEGGGALMVGESTPSAWPAGASLMVEHWRAGAGGLKSRGGGAVFTAGQLGCIGFRDPDGRPVGLYRAMAGPDGSVVPTAEAVKPIRSEVFSAAAAEARRAVYSTGGFKRLCGEQTLLKDGDKIAFFGDSLTWQGGYLAWVRRALDTGHGTMELAVSLANHGVNGAGVEILRDGCTSGAFVDLGHRDGPQKPFATLLREEKPRVAVVWVGINDVWWRGTSVTAFSAALGALCKAAREAGVGLVLAGPALFQERPDGGNPKDAGVEAFNLACKSVSEREGGTFVDLRRALLAYLWDHNAELQLDGSLRHQAMGVLTYDGVHLTEAGCQLAADLLCDGIARCLERTGRAQG